MVGAASLADPTGALTDRALRGLLPVRRRRSATGWVALDQELERAACRIMRQRPEEDQRRDGR